MSDFSVDIVGLDAMNRVLDALLDHCIDDGAEQLKREMDGVLEESRELVPFLTGDLQDTGTVSEPFMAEEQVAVSISYGDTEVNYALDQHENPNYQHAPGKTDKFVEIPLMEWTKDGPRRVALAFGGRVR